MTLLKVEPFSGKVSREPNMWRQEGYLALLGLLRPAEQSILHPPGPSFHWLRYKVIGGNADKRLYEYLGQNKNGKTKTKNGNGNSNGNGSKKKKVTINPGMKQPKQKPNKMQQRGNGNVCIGGSDFLTSVSFDGTDRNSNRNNS